MHKTQVFFVCPFSLERKTGTPIRAVTTISEVSRHRSCYVIAQGGAASLHSGRDVGFMLPFLRLPQFWAAVFLELLRKRPVLIHFFLPISLPPLLLYKALLKRNCRLIHEMHGILADSPTEWNVLTKLFFSAMDKIAVSQSDKTIVMSYSMRDFLTASYALPAEKIEVIWGPTELPAYKKPQRTAHLTVTYTGNDQPWQGLDNLLEASRLVLSKSRSVRFFFVGFDPKKYLRYRNKNTRFFGKVSDKELGAILNSSDVFASTRFGRMLAHHQYPHKLSKYMAFGRPVVATDVSDQRLIIHKLANCGIVVPPDNPAALAGAILELRSLPLQELLRMGMNARKFAEKNFSPKALYRKLEVLYDG